MIAQEIGEEWRNTTIFLWYVTLLSTLQIIPLVYFAVTNSFMSVVSSIATMESKHPSLFFTFYTNVLITFTWGVNISKAFKIYSFYYLLLLLLLLLFSTDSTYFPGTTFKTQQ